MIAIILLASTYLAQSCADILSRPITQTVWAWNTVVASDLTGKFSAEGNLTVFAPSDKAIQQLNETYPELFALTVADPEKLRQLIEYHVIAEFVSTDNHYTHFTTTLNATAIVNATNGVVTVTGGLGRSGFVVKSYKATNGVVHVLDAALIPPMPLTITGLFFGWSGFKDTATQAELYATIDSHNKSTL